MERQLAGPCSLGLALALKQLSMVQSRLKEFAAASKAIEEALASMEELGLQGHEYFGSILLTLGGLDREQGQYKETLATYDKADAVLVQDKEGNNYGVLLSGMAICHQRLHQWREAVACYKEAVEHSRTLPV